MKIIFNYSKLRGRITEKLKSQDEFANRLGISSTSLSYKLNNKSGFTQSEISKAMNVLSISPAELSDYFFNTIV